jgi:hypothetical protein
MIRVPCVFYGTCNPLTITEPTIYIRRELVNTYLPFLVQGLGLCEVYNDILRLSFLLVVDWFLVLHTSRFDSICRRY